MSCNFVDGRESRDFHSVVCMFVDLEEIVTYIVAINYNLGLINCVMCSVLLLCVARLCL